MNTVMNLWIP